MRGTGTEPLSGNASRRVHPRACGEQEQDIVILPTHDGSSPRMRGTVQALGEQAGIVRFIPAHAGNSQGSLHSARPPSVHPRACGEQNCSTIFDTSPSGSSPRMRGTESRQQRIEVNRRFIPAHAGNSPNGNAAYTHLSVHPRACGEQLPNLSRALPVSGSSPRMRGTDRHVPARRCVVRFIPAHAGNRERASVRHTMHAVHPRACGEQARRKSLILSPHGSSPRMRGTGFPRIRWP